MRQFFAALGILLLLIAAYLLLWPVDLEPYAWTPGHDPGTNGPFVPNDDLAQAEHDFAAHITQPRQRRVQFAAQATRLFVDNEDVRPKIDRRTFYDRTAHR